MLKLKKSVDIFFLIFEIVIVVFQTQNKLERSLFFQKTFY